MLAMELFINNLIDDESDKKSQRLKLCWL
jgi:hypothetical protein